MRILYIVPSLAQFGPVVVVNDLVKQMVAHSHNCTVFYFDEKEIEMSFDCPVEKIDFKKSIAFTQYDIVHSHGFRPDKYVAKYREYSGKTKYVTTLHNYVFKDLKYKYNVIVAQFFGQIWMNKVAKFDVVITLSKDALQYYRKIIKSNTMITYAYNTRVIDKTKILAPEEITELLTFKGDDILIGIIGSLIKRKGIDYVIKALINLPDYRLVVVGEGSDRDKLVALTKKAGVSNRCLFLGHKQDAYRYIPKFDIFALPSRSEGFPLVLLEAAVWGKACVTSNLPIFKETFEQEVEVFDINTPSSIISAIKRATSNNTLGISIQTRYMESYSPDAFYAKHINIYKGSNC